MTRSRAAAPLAIAIAIAFALAAVQVARSGMPRGAPTTAPTPSTPTPSGTGPAPSVTPSPDPTPSRSASAISTAACGPRGAKEFRYRLQIESGLPTSTSEFARTLRSALCDRRGWTASGTVRFRYDPKGTYLISLRSARGTEQRCTQILGYPAGTYYSCAGNREAVLNGDRWFGGSRYWPGPVSEYRRMVTNHEVGHVLGMHHRSCPGSGKLAPVMMQQSKGLKGCRRNPWPTGSELRALPFGR